MTTLQDLDEIFFEASGKMFDIAMAMSEYEWSAQDRRAYELVESISKTIEKMQELQQAFEQSQTFQDYNFDEFVEVLEKQVEEYQSTYDAIVAQNTVEQGMEM